MSIGTRYKRIGEKTYYTILYQCSGFLYIVKTPTSETVDYGYTNREVFEITENLWHTFFVGGSVREDT